MSPPRTSRAERLLDLVSLLLGAAQPVSWTDLVEAFPGDYGTGAPESCQRKWERDRKELIELGIPIERVERDEESPAGWAIDRRRYYMRDLALTTEERALLSVAGAAALAQPHFPLRADLAHALDKLLFEAPAGSHPLSRQIVVHLPARGAERQAGVLEALGRALTGRKRVLLRYRAFGGEVTEREVEPYGLAYRRGAWFLVAHCLLRGALRTFQVERIEKLQPNAASAGKPDYDVPVGFDVGDVVGREPWEYAVHAPIEARVRLDPEVAILAPGRFGKRATLSGREDGGMDVAFDVTFGESLIRELLSLAPHAELVSPASLRERVLAAAQAIAAAHGPEGTDARPSVSEASVTGVGAGVDAGVGAGVSAGAGRPKGGGALAAKEGGKVELQDRLRRALFLIPYAVARPGCTIAELAEAMRLPQEELLEELDFLRMVGRPPFSPADLVDIDVSDGRVHVALPQGLLRPPSLTPLEAAALDAAASTLTAEGGDALAAAREKLRAAIHPEAREQFDRVAGRVHLDHGSLEPEVATLIDTAIAQTRELALTYWTASRGEASRRTVRPLERVLHQGYWYLYAYCNTRKERRLFRLDRAADFAILDITFVPRQVDRSARFHRDSLYAPAPSAAQAAVRFESGPWARQEMIERLGGTLTRQGDDGAAWAAFPADGDAFVVSTVMSMAGVATLESPPELRDRIRALAERVARKHA